MLLFIPFSLMLVGFTVHVKEPIGPFWWKDRVLYPYRLYLIISLLKLNSNILLYPDYKFLSKHNAIFLYFCSNSPSYMLICTQGLMGLTYNSIVLGSKFPFCIDFHQRGGKIILSKFGKLVQVIRGCKERFTLNTALILVAVGPYTNLI